MGAGRRNRLTPEQRKALWAKPESNAGAGWESLLPAPRDPCRDDQDDYERSQRRAELEW